MAAPPPPAGPMPPPYSPAPMYQRGPIGVTVLGVLAISLGIFAVLGGLVVLVIGLLLAAGVGPALGLIEAVVGLLIGLFGILWIVAGMGLLRLRSWAWWLAVIVSVLDIVVSIPALPASAVTPAVSVIILVYSSRSPPLLRAAAADGHASRVPR